MSAPGAFTAVQISDCHVNPDEPASITRFKALRDRVADERPDLVVASGDVSDDGYRHPGFFEYVKESFAQWPAPVLVIPGNHDVGDKAGEANTVRPQYMARWHAVFGSDRFSVDREGWLLLGLNTQVIGSGLPEEGEQLIWLDDSLDRAEQEGRHAAVFLHAAAYLFEPDEVLTGGSQYWGFDPYPRRELVKRLHRPHVRLVANGHLHWHHVFERFNAKWVWCPSQHLIVDDAIFPRGGDVTGFVKYVFGAEEVSVGLVSLDTPSHTVRLFRPNVPLPGREPIMVAEVVLDLDSMLAADGTLLDGVADRLRDLAVHTRITVLTSETSSSLETALAALPAELHAVKDGQAKQRRVAELGRDHTIAIGNGRDDVAMVKIAAIGMAVIGPGGAAGPLIAAADVVVHDINHALDLIAHPQRLAATLRN